MQMGIPDMHDLGVNELEEFQFPLLVVAVCLVVAGGPRRVRTFVDNAVNENNPAGPLPLIFPTRANPVSTVPRRCREALISAASRSRTPDRTCIRGTSPQESAVVLC